MPFVITTRQKHLNELHKMFITNFTFIVEEQEVGMQFMRKPEPTARITGKTQETTLFDLLDRMSSPQLIPGSAHISRTIPVCSGNDNERFIADTLARMFESGQLRFKDPGKVKQAFQELFS